MRRSTDYPHFAIGIGSLDVTHTAADLRLPTSKMHIDAMLALQTGKRSVNVGLDLSLTGSQTLQAVLNITERGGHLGIQAWSLLDPNETID